MAGDPPRTVGSSVSLRMQVETEQGVLVIYEAAAEREPTLPSQAYLAWWRDFLDEGVYLFDRLLFTERDVELATRCLSRDLGVTVFVFDDDLPEDGGSGLTQSRGDGRPSGRDGWKAPGAHPEPAGPDAAESGTWTIATRSLAYELMGFAFPQSGPRAASGWLKADAIACAPVGKSAPVETGDLDEDQPFAPDDPDEAIDHALSRASCGCGGECCGSTNPCCRQDRCCGVVCPAPTGCESPLGCFNGSCYYLGRCESYDPCTRLICQSGSCVPEPVVCDDGDCWTIDTCTPGVGCVHSPRCPLPQPCERIRCVDNACIHEPRNCDDNDPCTTEYCDPGTGECVYEPVCPPPTSVCLGRRCSDGSCIEEPLDCDDGDTCTTEHCDASLGCVYEDLCPEPSDACHVRWCDNGTCSERPVDCDDGNGCTEEHCELSAGARGGPGCVYSNLCDDGDPCTLDECLDLATCVNRLACVDYNRCTYDMCTPDPANPDAAVCSYPPRQCVSCDTGTCYNGVCTAEGCSIALGSATVCPGGSVTLDVSGDCWPSCGAMSYAPAGPPPPGVSVAWPAGNSCSGGAHVRTATVTVSPDVAPGPVNIGLQATSSAGAVCFDYTIVNVVERVDLIFACVPPGQEVDPGGLLPVNDDDDNGNGVPDRDEAGPTFSEDDLFPLTLSRDAALTGSVELSLVAGGSRVKVYETANRGILIPLPHVFPAGDLPLTVFVEGVVVSGAQQDVELRLRFSDGGEVCEDRLRLTVVKFDIESLRFDSDHQLMRDNNADYEPTGTLFPEPEWEPGLAGPARPAAAHLCGADLLPRRGLQHGAERGDARGAERPAAVRHGHAGAEDSEALRAAGLAHR
ncbi:MAG: hypothetical protein HY763_09735 [Planctomycetes bacterium]|nr:hypothetical protein [Planctomycetota bacterium]